MGSRGLAEREMALCGRRERQGGSVRQPPGVVRRGRLRQPSRSRLAIRADSSRLPSGTPDATIRRAVIRFAKRARAGMIAVASRIAAICCCSRKATLHQG
jgi:hypothetical protein